MPEVRDLYRNYAEWKRTRGRAGAITNTLGGNDAEEVSEGEKRGGISLQRAPNAAAPIAGWAAVSAGASASGGYLVISAN